MLEPLLASLSACTDGRRRKGLTQATCVLGLVVALPACGDPDVPRRTSGYGCEFSVQEPVDMLSYQFTAEEVWAATEGLWAGTFPGDEASPSANVAITVARSSESPMYSVPHAFGPHTITETDRADCAGIVAPVDLVVESSNDTLNLHLEWVMVRGYSLSGALSDFATRTPHGVPFVHEEVEDEGRPGHMEFVLAFEADGDFYMSTQPVTELLHAGTRQ